MQDDHKDIEMRAQAYAFQVLVQHLQTRVDVQNIDLMNLGDFCRNCMSKWYRAGVENQGVEITYEDARKAIYGMDYQEWKTKYQTPATPEQMQKLEQRNAHKN